MISLRDVWIMGYHGYGSGLFIACGSISWMGALYFEPVALYWQLDAWDCAPLWHLNLTWHVMMWQILTVCIRSHTPQCFSSSSSRLWKRLQMPCHVHDKFTAPTIAFRSFWIVSYVLQLAMASSSRSQQPTLQSNCSVQEQLLATRYAKHH